MESTLHGHAFMMRGSANDSSLRERRRTHKVFTKDQYFYLNHIEISLKSNVVDVY